MSIKFFGQFLLEREVITSEQLLEAVSYQESKNLKFGQYAEKKGFLSNADVERLHEEQKTADMRIGELAVKLGMLETSQVEEVLTMQKNDHVQIGKCLVTKGFVDEAALQRELAAFREDQRHYARHEVAVPEGLKSAGLVSDIVDISVKMIVRMAGMEAKSDGGTIIDKEPAEAYSAVAITFSGGMNCNYVLMADEGASRSLAASIIGSDAADEDRDMVVDGVREFANVICGNILARFAQKGKSVEISIPHTLEYKDGYAILNGGSTVLYDIPTTGGNVWLALVLY